MKKLLIIDDDIHIGNMLEELLTKEGYSVSRAYSGTEALLVLAGMKPDLILLDLMLPGLNGEEVLPQMKGIPVIVVSAKADIDNNAIKYSSGDLEIVMSEAGEIVFSNTASGLNQVQVGKLFDRFYTVEAARTNLPGLDLLLQEHLWNRCMVKSVQGMRMEG